MTWRVVLIPSPSHRRGGVEDLVATADPDVLLPLALSRPHEALDRARAVIARRPGPAAASVAHQAIGIVLREVGDINAAVTELRTALRLARRSGETDRELDVLASLGVALVLHGRPAAGLGLLDIAARRAVGRLRGRILLRRGGALLVLGRHASAVSDLNDAIVELRQAGDQLWEARALTERAVALMTFGSVPRAVTDLLQAERLFSQTGQELESADAVVHRGLVALQGGDLLGALACFDEAGERFERLGTPDPSLAQHRCDALLSAG